MPNIRQPKRLVSHELIDFAARDAAAFVEFCEQRYAARIQAASEQILRSGARIVMLTGPSGTGKTTSANRLAEAIRAEGRRAAVVSLDDFFVGEGRYPKRADGSDDYECPEALDLPALHGFLAALAREGRATSPVFDFLTQLPSGKTRAIDCAGGVAIVEGLHALNPLLAEGLPADAVLNVYASLREEYTSPGSGGRLKTREMRLARRITRDHRFRGHAPEFTLELWGHVCDAERQYVQAFRERADLLLDTSFSYEPCLWAGVLNGLLGQTDAAYAGRFSALCREFAAFVPVSPQAVPAHSMLREFIGPKAEH